MMAVNDLPQETKSARALQNGGQLTALYSF
jgi:hypothetical protein